MFKSFNDYSSSGVSLLKSSSFAFSSFLFLGYSFGFTGGPPAFINTLPYSLCTEALNDSHEKFPFVIETAPTF